MPESRPGRVLLVLHGGSFAFRLPNTYAGFAARLCRRFEAQELVVDYWLAPEHPFPAAPDDGQAAYRWLLATGQDPHEVVLVGDSAGGNLGPVTLNRALQGGHTAGSTASLPWSARHVGNRRSRTRCRCGSPR